MLLDNFITLDLVVIVLYLILSLVLGIWGSRMMGMKNNNESDYYLAGRRMPGWINGISVAATALNSDVAPLYCGIAVVCGLSGCWFFLSRFGMAMIVGSVLFSVCWRRMKIRTGPEFFQLRFGKGSKIAQVYSSVSSVCIGMIPWIGAGLIGLHLVAGPIFGIESKAVTLLIVLPILTVYVWTSGLAGVLLTDAMQGIVILGANFLMVGMVLWTFGGPTGLHEAVSAAMGPEAQSALSLWPQSGNPVASPFTVAAWLILVTIGSGSSVSSDGQRMFSCRSDYEAAKVGIWGEITLFLMLLMLMLPALGLLAKHPEMYHYAPGQREQAYGMMLQEFLPRGGIGLTVAALLAAVMSTISTHLNYGSQTLLNDVWRPLFGEPAKGREVWIGRMLMLVMVAMSVAVVFCADSLLGIALTVLGLFGTSAAFGWGQWWYWRVNFKSWCASVLGGPAVYLLCGVLLPLIPWWQAQIAQGEAQAQMMQLFQAVIALVINTAIFLSVSLLTKPEKMEVLEQYYLRARPMGCWGPVRQSLIAKGRLPAEENRPGLLRGFAVATLGFIMIAAGVLSLSAFYTGKWCSGGVFLAVTAGSGLFFRKHFKQYIKELTE